MADSLAAALAELQANPPRIRKKARGQHGNYADLPAVHRVLMPRLAQLGLLWQTWPNWVPVALVASPDAAAPGMFFLCWRLTHLASGEKLDGAYPIYATDPQKAGSEITYARRYSIVTVIGATPEGDDDDGQAASRQRTPAKIPGPDHERLQPRAEPGDRPAERVRAGDNPPVDMWMGSGTPESDTQPEERPGSVSAEQLRQLGIAFTKAGITDKAVRLGMVSDMIGRTVMSSKQLSQVEYEFIVKRIKDGEQP